MSGVGASCVWWIGAVNEQRQRGCRVCQRGYVKTSRLNTPHCCNQLFPSPPLFLTQVTQHIITTLLITLKRQSQLLLMIVSNEVHSKLQIAWTSSLLNPIEESQNMQETLDEEIFDAMIKCRNAREDLSNVGGDDVDDTSRANPPGC